jgi:hypothetical protein
MWTGLIFVCVASIPNQLCGMDNAYQIFRIQRSFQSQQECIEATKHHFEAVEVEGDRNARFECEPREAR